MADLSPPLTVSDSSPSSLFRIGSKFLPRLKWPIWGCGLALMLALPSHAAEKVVLKYSILQESVSVPELSQLSQTGEVSPSIQAYLTLANRQPEELRQWLNASLAVTPQALTDLLNSFVGKYLLGRLNEVVHTPSDRSNTEALRGALITSAQGDNRVSLIEVLENYPTPEIHIEGDRLMELYQQIKVAADKFSRLSL
ncbi:MAG: alpha/beta hydrolase [Microcystaceae cyanobacterium]